MTRPRHELAEVRQWTRWLAGAWQGSTAPPPSAALHSDLLQNARLLEHVEAFLGDDIRSSEQGTRRTLAENMLALESLRHIGRELTRAEIAWCAIKGAAVLVREPRLQRVRRMSDIDIVVSASRLDDAVLLFVKMGGNEVRDVATTSTRSVHFRRPGVAIAFDLHGGLGLGRHFGELGDELLQSAQVTRGIAVPTLEYLVLATVLHRAKGLWSGDLREVFDLWVLLHTPDAAAATPISPDMLSTRADALGLGPHLLLCTAELENWFGSSDALAVLRRTLEARLDWRQARVVRLLAAQLQRHGGLRWVHVPVAARYGTLALLDREPLAVLQTGMHYAGVRLKRVLSERAGSGGRAGRWFSRRG